MAGMFERLTGAAAARATGGTPKMGTAMTQEATAAPLPLPKLRTGTAEPHPSSASASPFSAPAAFGLSPTSHPTSPPSAADEQQLAVWRLETQLTRSGSAADVSAAAKDLLTPDAVFSWPLGRAVGRAAIARSFCLLQLLFVDDCTIDGVALGDVDAASPLFAQPAFLPHPHLAAPRLTRRVAMARLTHRLTPRFMDALSPLPVPVPEKVGGVVAASWPGGEPYRPPASYLAYRGAYTSPLPATLRPIAAWLRARLTFKLVDNATYVFALPSSSPGAAAAAAASSAAAGTTAFAPAPPQIQLIRAEIALVSLVYALPFGEALWHGLAEPLMGATAGVLEAAWRGVVKPWLAGPWARARFGGGYLGVLDAL